jgi:hypothetical protein
MVLGMELKEGRGDRMTNDNLSHLEDESLRIKLIPILIYEMICFWGILMTFMIFMRLRDIPDWFIPATHIPLIFAIYFIANLLIRKEDISIKVNRFMNNVKLAFIFSSLCLIIGFILNKFITFDYISVIAISGVNPCK